MAFLLEVAQCGDRVGKGFGWWVEGFVACVPGGVHSGAFGWTQRAKVGLWIGFWVGWVVGSAVWAGKGLASWLLQHNGWQHDCWQHVQACVGVGDGRWTGGCMCG
jgi:hypothetical protein